MQGPAGSGILQRFHLDHTTPWEAAWGQLLPAAEDVSAENIFITN